ncbi:RNA polymerase sigma factor [Xanthomonas medicagonis]|uniref:RNA polymerase sigma factor n=1 Tax=Xanthomonas medicagonis TaxID=3160841 RepID=UPI003517101C
MATRKLRPALATTAWPGGALSALYQRCRPALLSFFRHRVADPSEAEDLTHQVFANLAASPGAVCDDGYLFRSATNLLRDRARREKVRSLHRQRQGATAEHAVETLDPPRVLAGRQALGEVADALERLAPRTRAIFLQFRLENMSQAQIASRYGISVSAVQKHLLRAMTELAELMERAP